MTDATITPASPVKLAETAIISAASIDAATIRVNAEKAVASARTEVSTAETSISTTVKADVSAVESLWARYKPYAPSFLIGWVIGWVAGYFGPHLHL